MANRVINGQFGQLGEFTLKTDVSGFCSGAPEFLIDGRSIVPTDFKKCSAEAYSFGGVSGEIERDECDSEGGLRIGREVFRSSDGCVVAVRYVLQNESDKAAVLDKVFPIKIQGESNLSIGKGKFSDCQVFRLARQKNETPTSYRPCRIDQDYKDATFNTTGLVAGKGVGLFDSDTSIRTVEAEPLAIFSNDANRAMPGLMFCIVGQFNHLAKVCISANDELDGLDSVIVEYEFDQRHVLPCTSVSTHWLLFAEDDDENELLDMYARIAKSMYQIKEPPRPSTVYCSWYFYNKFFNQDDLKANCQCIKESNFPADALVIDNGWMDEFGNYEANERFSDGMIRAAEIISDAGMRPGIWTAPFIVHAASQMLKKYPNMLAHDPEGNPVGFETGDGLTYVVDPTMDDGKKYIHEVFTKLRDWGYTYHKLDWLRCIPIRPDVRFGDPTFNRPMAYKLFLELIREAVGPDAYLAGCGGVYDGINFGLVESYRTSRDARGSWHINIKKGFTDNVSYIKANLFRNYTNAFWVTDPDAAMLRRRNKKYYGDKEIDAHETYLSLGTYNDDEAFTMLAMQFLCGGNISLTEPFPELDEDRRLLYRNVIPSINSPARILDVKTPHGPTVFLTAVSSDHPDMDNWFVLTLCNWEDGPVEKLIKFSDLGLPVSLDEFTVQEFVTGRFVGIQNLDGELVETIPPHGTRVFKLTPWNGKGAVISQTDLHISGGKEISEISISDGRIEGSISNPWSCSVTIHAVFPSSGGGKLKTVVVEPGVNRFDIS